jgi:hypothetical protein
MSVKAFVNAGYALIVEDFLRVPGMLLDPAIDHLRETFGMERQNPEADEAALNQQSLRQLEQMMAGVR